MNLMVLVTTRCVNHSGGSYSIAVPAEWAKRHHINGGDEVIVIANELVVIIPKRPIDRGSISRALDDAKTIAFVAQSDLRSPPPALLEDK